MNVLHAKELARRLAGTRVTTYALHPGGVASNIWRSVPQPLRWIILLFLVSNEEGAKTQLWCATAPELASETGRYYDKCREAPCSPLANDPALAARAVGPDRGRDRRRLAGHPARITDERGQVPHHRRAHESRKRERHHDPHVAEPGILLARAQPPAARTFAASRVELTGATVRSRAPCSSRSGGASPRR